MTSSSNTILFAISFLLGLSLVAAYSCDSSLLLGNQAVRPKQTDGVRRPEALPQPPVFLLVLLRHLQDARPRLAKEALWSSSPEEKNVRLTRWTKTHWFSYLCTFRWTTLFLLHRLVGEIWGQKEHCHCTRAATLPQLCLHRRWLFLGS